MSKAKRARGAPTDEGMVSSPELPCELAESGQIQRWDAVDEASWESFPASDPPPGWAGRDTAPPTPNGDVAAAPARRPKGT